MESMPHRAWCNPSDCYTAQDGLVVHVGPETVFDPAGGGVSVRLVDDGIEVTLTVTLTRETAAELAQTLTGLGERAWGFSRLAQ